MAAAKAEADRLEGKNRLDRERLKWKAEETAERAIRVPEQFI